MMIGVIIVLIVISICSYCLGYCGAKINVTRTVVDKNLAENYGGV